MSTHLIQRVLIIGGGPSYWDIAQRIAPHAKGNLLVSTNNNLEPLSSDNQRNVPKVVNLLPKNSAIYFADGSRESDIDIILFCKSISWEQNFPYQPSHK